MTHRFLLRLPVELFERLREEAAESRRSVNSEIVSRLEGVRAPGEVASIPMAAPPLEPSDAVVLAVTGVCVREPFHRKGEFCKSCGKSF